LTWCLCEAMGQWLKYTECQNAGKTSISLRLF
jgi:hypothetical protein